MIASVILMVLTLIAMFTGLLAPTYTIPVMMLWSSLGIMTEIRRSKSPKKTIEEKGETG